jgi:CheY-like chemotaxis protein
MLGMDGFELRDLARKIRPDLPVFLITGRHELMDDERVKGADGLFRKPFDARALLAAIEDVCAGAGTEATSDT